MTPCDTCKAEGETVWLRFDEDNNMHAQCYDCYKAMREKEMANVPASLDS